MDEILFVIIVDVYIFTLIAHECFGTIRVNVVEKGGRQKFYVVTCRLHVINLEIGYMSLRWDCAALTMHCLHLNLVILYTSLIGMEPICGVFIN